MVGGSTPFSPGINNTNLRRHTQTAHDVIGFKRNYKHEISLTDQGEQNDFVNVHLKTGNSSNRSSGKKQVYYRYKQPAPVDKLSGFS